MNNINIQYVLKEINPIILNIMILMVMVGIVILDDGVAMLFVYMKIKDKITPEINAKVEDTLNEWFGVEYELIKG